VTDSIRVAHIRRSHEAWDDAQASGSADRPLLEVRCPECRHLLATVLGTKYGPLWSAPDPVMYRPENFPRGAASIAAARSSRVDRPVLALINFPADHDGGEPPLLGRCKAHGQYETTRLAIRDALRAAARARGITQLPRTALSRTDVPKWIYSEPST
jgi:hypothetical protein